MRQGRFVRRVAGVGLLLATVLGTGACAAEPIVAHPYSPWLVPTGTQSIPPATVAPVTPGQTTVPDQASVLSPSSVPSTTIVPSPTAVTNSTSMSSPTAVTTPTSTPSPTASGSAAETPSTAVPSGCRATVVYLDPGHGGNVTPRRATSGGSQGIFSGESANAGNEDADVFAVATQAMAALREAGYVVELSRSDNPDPLRQTLWQKGNKAEVARDGNPADIAVSIHTDVRANVGAGLIFYDKLGGYRQNESDGVRATFTNEATARLSQQYAAAFQAERERIQGATIAMTAGTEFPASRHLGSFGDIPIVMLSAPGVPWVYNEMGRTTDAGLSAAAKDIYARGIVAGVTASLPATVCP